jgi:hypothetical protein
MKPTQWKSLVLVYFAGVLGLYGFVVWSVRRLIVAGLPDFAIYYCAGTVVRHGMGPQLYDPLARFEVQKQFATAVPLFRGPLPWTHPPFEALFFVPFSYFSYLHAYLLWNLLNLVLFGATLFLLRPFLSELRSRAPGLWLLAAFAFFPVFFNLLEGQDAIILLFLYATAVVCLQKRRDALAGMFLALGLFKFHLVLPFVLLMLLQKRWKLLYGFVPASLLLVFTSIGIAGLRSLTDYPRYVLYWEDIMAGKDRVPAGMPNLRGLTYVLLPQGSYVGPLLVVMSVALLFFVAWRCRSAPSSPLFVLNLSLVAVATVLVSYHVVSYDLCILLVPILLLANDCLKAHEHHWPRTFIITAIAALFCSPLELFLSLQYKQFALMGLVLLLWLCGIAGEIGVRSRS